MTELEINLVFKSDQEGTILLNSFALSELQALLLWMTLTPCLQIVTKLKTRLYVALFLLC